MKKRLAVALMVLFFLSGCALGDTSGSVQTDSGGKDNIPGTYIVPEGWVKSEQYSSEDKIFYVEEGHEKDTRPDNISIEIGTNRYGLDEHDKFRYAILRQLSMQSKGSSANVTGEGVHTEQDYIMYIFTIDDDYALTRQYYIVDDHRYCLIHLTDFSGNEDAADAARAIADSFVWDETDTPVLAP
ncbi:MAG: hypothetical protein HFG14_03705 [Lachnospiraceae bacterium]|nr:hypothetical protein [Lachnospiraceae bacterium]NBJ80963.1 hypothetical protein [bacterium 1XD42-76]NBK04172.1 hypothetical protein [bacterium 1XD42-94]